jgi:1,4-dihydroxy-2-naphthoate octaprenyltransferase
MRKNHGTGGPAIIDSAPTRQGELLPVPCPPSSVPSSLSPVPWLLAARPKTLPASAAPVLLGSACAFAAGSFRLGPALAALAGALLIQIGTNYANDVGDFERGTDTNTRVGPTRVTQAGLLSPRAVKIGAAVVFGAAALIGVYLTAVAGWPVLVIGAASILAGLAYTAGPFPLSHRGWGEPFVLVFFGFVAVAGTAYVQALQVPPSAWWGGLIAGAFSTAILVVNNTRDHATDRAAGRGTIPARFGKRAGVVELAVFLVLGYLGTIGMVIAQTAPPHVLLACATAPLAFGIARTVASSDDGPTLNKVLARTGALLLLHAVLLSAVLVGATALAR